MKQVVVELGNRSYPIYIGAGLLQRAADLIGTRLSEQTLVVSNTIVAPLYLETLLDGLTGIQARTLIVEDGERHKTAETMNGIITRLLEQQFNRTCTLIALGGG